MRVALYARVSTLNGQNPETRLMELREYASRRGWQVVDEYVDAGVSGSKDSRRSLNRLDGHAQQRRFDGIVVWKPGQVWPQLEASRHGHRRTGGAESYLRQPPGQLGP